MIPEYDIPHLATTRLETRATWATDFDKNHRAFAETLASKIAKEALEEFQQALSNPYGKAITADRKFIKNFYLDVTDQDRVKKLLTTIPENEIPSPFNHWLTHFSAKESRHTDRKYFKEQMALVGSIAVRKIEELLSQFKEKTSKFEYSVVWHSKSDQLLSNPSDFRDNCITIELWSRFRNNTIKENSEAVTKLRTKQADIAKGRKGLCYTVLGITAFAVAAAFSAIMQSQPYDN